MSAGPLANGGLTPAEVAEPTPADIAQRLADDAMLLAKRVDDFAGPLTDEQATQLGSLAESIRDLVL